MREQPVPDYFPSCRARFVLRFEEFGATDAPPPPAKIPQLRTGKKDEAPLEVKKEGARLLLLPKGGNVQAPGGPQGQLDPPDDRTHVVEGVFPISCEVRRNGIREADECSITLSLADFPFDPRAIRSCAVQVYMGTVTPDEFRLGAEGINRGDKLAGGNASGDPLSAVADTYLDPYGNQRSNLRFSGWVDEYNSEFPEDDQAVAILECVDNAKLLADQTAPPKLAISANLPVDEAVAAYLANFPQCAGLEIELRPPDAPRPTLKSALGASAFKPDLGPPSDGKATALDYIADTVMALGFMVWIEDVTVVLQRPRTLYATGAVRADDPFTGRRLPSGRVLDRRTLLYGVNVRSLSFGRKLGRKTAACTEVRSYSGRQKKTLTVRHPPKGQRPTSTTPGGQTDEKWNVIEVAGIESEEALRAIAQAVYEASNRHELTATIRTPCLGSLGGGNDDPDLLDVQSGDAIDVEVIRADQLEEDEDGGTFAGGASQEPSRAESYLTKLGYSRDLARAYAKALGASAFPTTFRVKTWSMSWDQETGIEVTGELMNYVEARVDRALPEGEEPAINQSPGEPVRVKVD